MLQKSFGFAHGRCVLGISACNKAEIPDNIQDTAATVVTVQTTSPYKLESAKLVESDIKAAYLNKLNEDCKDMPTLYNAYFYENKGGNPVLAFSNVNEYDTWPTPDHVYHYIDGKIIDTCFTTATGSAEKHDVYFVEDTSAMAFRELGNSGGTLCYGIVTIYIFDSAKGEYNIISEEVSYEGNIVHYGNPSSSDYEIIQGELNEKMDKVLEEYLGVGYKLVSYSENMVTKKCADYLSHTLGDDVIVKNYTQTY